MDWQLIGMMVAGGLLLYLVYRGYRANPEQFSWANTNKSLYTLGLLALGLVGFIYVLVLLLKA